MIATARVSVNIDEDVKQRAQKLYGEMGLDLTTAIDLFFRMSLIEKRLPFEVRTEEAYRDEAAHAEYVRVALEESKLEAANPNTRRYTHEEVRASLKEQREARKHVAI